MYDNQLSRHQLHCYNIIKGYYNGIKCVHRVEISHRAVVGLIELQASFIPCLSINLNALTMIMHENLLCVCFLTMNIFVYLTHNAI